MKLLSLKLLGSYRLSMEGHSVATSSLVKARALLAYLAIERDRPHLREKLVGLLWSESDETHARGSLSQTLYQLRGILGDRERTGSLSVETTNQTREPCLLVTTQEIQLNPHCDLETDVAVFSRLVDACKTHAHPQLISVKNAWSITRRQPGCMLGISWMAFTCRRAWHSRNGLPSCASSCAWK